MLTVQKVCLFGGEALPLGRTEECAQDVVSCGCGCGCVSVCISVCVSDSDSVRMFVNVCIFFFECL
jgi:hypothetical protein